jgi:hypothetical protein
MDSARRVSPGICSSLSAAVHQNAHCDIMPLFPELAIPLPVFSLVLNIPLVDVTEENGPLEVWPGGTHLNPDRSNHVTLDNSVNPHLHIYLLETTEDELIAELVVKLRELIPRIIREENINPFLPPLEFYQRYSKFLKILLGANGDPNFIHKIKTILKKTLRELLKKEQIPEADNMEYVMEFISSAMIGIISHWLSNDMSLPIDQLGEMIKKIMNHGPIGYLKTEMNL